MHKRSGMETGMKVIGITGGIGAGKTEILGYLQRRADCRVIIADRAAHELEKRGGICYDRLVALLGKEVLSADGEIDKARMAARIFADRKILDSVNAIVHPAVKEYIAGEIDKERERGAFRYLFIEAALLIEGGYDQIVDELWYIYADEETRRERLKKSRGYSDEKTDSIMRQQMADHMFRRHCRVVIDNSKTLAYAYQQIDEKLGEDLCQRK